MWRRCLTALLGPALFALGNGRSFAGWFAQLLRPKLNHDADGYIDMVYPLPNAAQYINTLYSR